MFWHVDGSYVPIEYISTPIVQDGKPNGAVVIFRDISKQKDIERQREEDYAAVKALTEQLEQERDYLRNEIKAGRFREDLFYRVSVFPVEVPPLRERLDDIAPLAFRFLERICRELGREPLRMTESQVSVLQQLEWPGNIRELKNVIERAVISTTGSRLRLDLALSNAPAAIRSPTELSKQDLSEFVTIEEFKELEKAKTSASNR